MWRLMFCFVGLGGGIGFLSYCLLWLTHLLWVGADPTGFITGAYSLFSGTFGVLTLFRLLHKYPKFHDWMDKGF